MATTEHDPSPTMHDPKTQRQGDYVYREQLENYYQESPGSHVEKLENFTKYVPRQNLARFLARYEIFKRIKDIQGSIVECGVLFGGGLMSFAQMSTILEPYNFQRKLFGFDTFEGFPSIHEQDLAGLDDRKSAHLKDGGFAAPQAYDDLMKAIELYDSNRYLNHFPKIKLYKGDFEKTAKQFLEDYPHTIISCLYLDFDIYQPTKTALELFYERVPKGGIIVFDELNEEAFPGETQAVREVLKINNLKIQRFDFEPRISYAIVGE